MPNEIAPNVLSWASELDELTTEQAARTARLPILAGHLALMPDAHFGMGATIGSVIPTETAVRVGVPAGPCLVLHDRSGNELALLQQDRPDAMQSAYQDLTNPRRR